ncbi:S-adenosyl-L-methionine-dependent methyltransferase [Dactylonectria estremocensis]|uniref:S-adenosyl-L-methionine-dependent methyltransferase n=1 Tax=Dactylonectria estremocensis TaxID=1079267 RepID=A0A9P9ILE9_9HYPO|nr:S-adenosyl-L-methionine-dependent methyltransferase [Dactylonectria estremocensis]
MTSQTQNIIEVLDGVSHDSFISEVERLRVRAAARRLLARVESPYERAWGFCFEQPVVFAALQTCIDLGLWGSWNAAGGGEKTIDELLKFAKHDVEPDLLRRFFRLLAAFNVVEEIAEDTFKPTPFSTAIGDESTKVRASLEAANYQYILAGHNLPKYLAKTGYRVPSAADDNNHSGSDPDGLNFFGRLQKSPEYYEAFTGHMEAWTAWKTPWTKLFDPRKLIEGANLGNGSPLVVDLGGNTGIDISHVLNAAPDLPTGALVLQDLPEIIARAKVDDKISAIAHDFFLPQPVKGSRAYFMHAVLHDWPDDKATELLQNTRDAMVKGYSKLFVYDIVVPPTGASISQTTMDVNMMSLLSASERTKSQWEKLLTGAGFKIVNFWPDPQEYEMLIEAEIV